MTKRLDLPQTLLVVAAFLTPLIGGWITTDGDTLPGGLFASLSTVFGGSSVPTLSHAVLALLVGGAFATLLLTRRVVQVPNNTLAVTLSIFGGGVLASLIVSDFRTVSAPIGLEWLTYVLAFFAVIGAAGRRVGPLSIIAAFVAGTTLLAALGIREYGVSTDPNWRIFSLWIGPNALAAMLLIGLMLSLGLVVVLDRRGSLLAGVSATLIGVALLLTQSKGALFALPVGLVALVCGGAIWAKDDQAKRLLRVIYPAVAIIALTIVVHLPTLHGGRAGSFDRITDAASTSEQSSDFRKLLWKTSIELVKQDTAGSGIGTFRFTSAKPGIVTSTELGHNTYLQLASEVSPFVALIFVAGIILWLRLIFRGIKTLPWDSRVLLAATLSAVLAILAHSIVDSDLYYFGIGLSVFMLMGVALLLSADSVAPEFLFKSIRHMGVVAAIIPVAGLFYFSATETLRAEARAGLSTGDLNTITPPLQTLHSIAPSDGEAWYLTALSASTPGERLSAAEQAVNFAPSTRNLRLLARVQMLSNQVPQAMATVQRALRQDPNGLTTLMLLAEFYKKQGNQDDYEKTLHRVLDVEKTTYFKVRSLPELVPTETYEARLELADVAENRKEQLELLSEAVAGFKAYLKTTVPKVKQMTTAGLPSFAGEDPEKVKKKMTKAADAAQRLSKLERDGGDDAAADAAAADAAAFLDSVSK